MQVDIVTIFPQFFDSPLACALLGKAGERNLVTVRCHDLRDWTHDRHRSVDDAPFGGGAGMVMKPAPWFEALDDLLAPEAGPPARVVQMAPDGHCFDQAAAARLAKEERLVLCCGRYEGVDERVRTRVDEVLSVGDYVLAGGESAAMVVLDAVVRLVPGVMGNNQSAVDESFSSGLLEYPQYTRPAAYRGLEVPEVLRSGDHGAVARWRRAQAVERTLQVRPDLLGPDGPAAFRGDAGRPSGQHQSLHGRGSHGRLGADRPDRGTVVGIRRTVSASWLPSGRRSQRRTHANRRQWPGSARPSTALSRVSLPAPEESRQHAPY